MKISNNNKNIHWFDLTTEFNLIFLNPILPAKACLFKRSKCRAISL